MHWEIGSILKSNSTTSTPGMGLRLPLLELVARMSDVGVVQVEMIMSASAAARVIGKVEEGEVEMG